MGPLANVDTITAGINLDVQRLLYMGANKSLKFIVPDSSQISKWRTLLTIVSGFNRVTGTERTSGDGSEVIFQVADTTGIVKPVLSVPDLHVEVEDEVYSVARVPPRASSQSQVFTLTCKVRTIRQKFFDNKK